MARGFRRKSDRRRRAPARRRSRSVAPRPAAHAAPRLKGRERGEIAESGSHRRLRPPRDEPAIETIETLVKRFHGQSLDHPIAKCIWSRCLPESVGSSPGPDMPHEHRDNDQTYGRCRDDAGKRLVEGRAGKDAYLDGVIHREA